MLHENVAAISLRMVALFFNHDKENIYCYEKNAKI
jgi:hypothetical protein